MNKGVLDLLAQERQRRILELVSRQQSVSIAALAHELGVSSMTIRRDLAKLTAEGKIKRVYGGAVSNLPVGYEPPYPAREGEDVQEKRQIAKVAASLLQPGDAVLLATGTTVVEVARAIDPALNLTVVTSSLPVAMELVAKPKVKLIMAGGLLRREGLSTTGHMAEYCLGEINADKLITSAAGLSLEEGITEYSNEDAVIKRVMLERARQVIVVSHHSKLERVAFASVAPLDVVDVLITDGGVDRELVELYQEQGIKVITASEKGNRENGS